MVKNRSKSNTCDVVRFFPSWLTGNEEDFLDSMALKGWKLSCVTAKSVYTFVRTEPGKDRYAVELLGSRENDMAEVENDESAGWEFIGVFDRKRYYRMPVGVNALTHPSADSPTETEKLASVMTNLTTLLLLNIPGTLIALVYTVFVLSTGGIGFIGFSSYLTLYVIGAPLGLVSIAVFWRWLKVARRRRNKINNPAGIQTA